MNPFDVQIIINSRDRPTPLRALISWLQNSGYTNLFILDNDSTYPPLLEYYQELEGCGSGVTIWRAGKNLLSKALWTWPQAHELVRAPFIYTDSDIVPVDECPSNVVEFLLRVSEKLGKPYKVGLSLKHDDIPDCYALADKVRTWESQCWEPLGTVDGVPIYSAGVDTTFALYSYFAPFQISGVRVGAPYGARHLPWYTDSANPSEEEIHYEYRVERGTHNWGINECYSMAVNAYCENISGGREQEDGLNVEGSVEGCD